MRIIKLLILMLFLVTATGADVYDNLVDNWGDIGGFYPSQVDYVGDDLYTYKYPITFEKIVTQLSWPGTPIIERIVYNIIRKSDMTLVYNQTEYEPEGTFDFNYSGNYIFRYEHELSLYVEAGTYIIATKVFSDNGSHVLVNNVRWRPAIHGEYDVGWYMIDDVNDAAMRIEFQYEELSVKSTSLGNIKATYK